MAAMADALSTLGASFITFFSIANPIGSALIFDRAVADLSWCVRRRLARHIALLSGVIVIVAAVAGSDILHALGIRLDTLRVAGGLILGAQAWRLISQDASERSEARVGGTLVPLTVPLTIGPGTIAAAISLGAASAARPHALVHLAAVLLSVLLLAALIAITYGNARRIVELLGNRGSRAAVQLSSFVLLCIAVEMVLQGLRNTMSS
jgi:multiple antibiotic resistance protein